MCACMRACVPCVRARKLERKNEKCGMRERVLARAINGVSRAMNFKTEIKRE